MNIADHRDFLLQNMSQLGHPFIADHFCEEEMKAFNAAGEVMNRARQSAVLAMSSLHDAWVKAGQPFGVKAGAFFDAYTKGEDWPKL